MAVKIRLQRHGSKKRPFYFIVVADARAPRDGKFIQKIGTYNPLTVPATIQLDRQKALEWLHKGAEPPRLFLLCLLKCLLLKGCGKYFLNTPLKFSSSFF